MQLKREYNTPFTSAALRWLYVDFNSYFASVEQQLNPALRGKPIAVVPVETDGTCAIAASYEAKAFGVRTGTMIYEAKRMCPGLICVPARHEHYVAFHNRICEEIERHIPVTMVCSIDEVACRLMDNENNEEQVTIIARSIKQGLRDRVGEYVRCSIGVAPNRYLAKVATDLKKPDGFTLLTLDSLPDRLLGLGLRDLPGIGRNMEKRLRMNGIGTLQDLWNLDAKNMRRIWHGVWGERMWYMLRGWNFEEEETTRGSVGHSHVLAPELRGQVQARHVARRLTLKAASRLRRLGYRASGLYLSVRIEKGSRWRAEARCQSAQDNITFLHMLDAMWSAMVRENGAVRLKKVSVLLHDLESNAAAEAQPGLFEEMPAREMRVRRRAEKLSVAMDRLNHRYGRDTVSLGMLPAQGRSFSGTKIAFTRIPDAEEFLE